MSETVPSPRINRINLICLGVADLVRSRAFYRDGLGFQTPNDEESPEIVFWGGYSGYFRDPDGYYWEVAHADSWKFDSNDMLVIE